MVAKQDSHNNVTSIGLNLAKIHMVAKQVLNLSIFPVGLNLAKIHMVAKHFRFLIHLHFVLI